MSQFLEFFLVKDLPKNIESVEREEYTPHYGGAIKTREASYRHHTDLGPEHLTLTSLRVDAVGLKFRIISSLENHIHLNGESTEQLLERFGYKVVVLGLGTDVKDVLIPFTNSLDKNYNCSLLIDGLGLSTSTMMTMAELFKDKE